MSTSEENTHNSQSTDLESNPNESQTNHTNKEKLERIRKEILYKYEDFKFHYNQLMQPGRTSISTAYNDFQSINFYFRQ